MSGSSPPSLRSQLGALAGLLLLLAATAGLAYVPMGAFNTVVALLISLAKTLLVMLIFMRLRSESAVVRLVAIAGFAWLAMLFLILMADYLTRVTLPPPY
ncbi:cytochrome C oxidase subunit IV family protein [Dyella sp.]|jgi:caa(3)-type oxidase subunit IV|uniref:cytochrome C oxidase subunit IV family protein n=1 Tax=Dyella sp. TaxID=1869338 RepID=UPI002D79057B|nr:cytochrome C oxidase subunit IV family protein [Dyella sp.]HET6432783.1 cytochrome C oxidase subunit IV family protein [Dyella sp.]